MSVPLGNATFILSGLIVGAVAAVTGCIEQPSPADVADDADTAEVSDEWVRRFPERSTCDRESAIPYSTVEDWVGCWNAPCDWDMAITRGQPDPYAAFCENDDRLYILYLAEAGMPDGPWLRVREVDAGGELGPVRQVEMASAFDGQSVHPWATACYRGRFRVVVSGPASWSEDSATDPDLYVKYMLEVDPTTASLTAPPRYLNGVGRGGVERLTVYSLLGFRKDGERLFYAGSPPPYPEIDAFFSVGEYDLDWDGVWDDDWHSWARWINMDGGDQEDLLWRWAAPVGERIVYAWAHWLNGYTTGQLAIGPQPEGMDEAFDYQRVVSIEDLMQAGPMPRSGFLQMAVGTRTLAAACDEWMLVFDHDLERVGRPVNFSAREDGWSHYRLIFGGGYYAVIHRSPVERPSPDYTGGLTDFAISVVNEDAEFVDRKVLLCPTDGLPNTLPNYDSYLMDAYWNGEGFWMVFATQPVFPGPWELRVFFLPVP